MSERFFELVGPRMLAHTTAEWSEIFAAADVPASAVMTKAEHIADVQVANNAIYRIVAETVGDVRRTRHPALFDGAPAETDDLPCSPLSARADDSATT